MSGFLELPENGDLRGKCETNYFHIYLYKDLPHENIVSYEPSLKGTFMHEYLHYIQFINTPFGISYGTAYSNYFSHCVHYFLRSEEIIIPLRVRSEFPELDKLLNKYSRLKGSNPGSVHLQNILVEEAAIHHGRIEKVAVKIEGVQTDSHEILPLELGYLGIIENMAVIFQSFFDPALSDHSSVPYHMVEIFLRNRAKPITDKKLIFSMCLCALMFDNPGVGFFDVLNIFEANPSYDGIKLYKHVLSLNIIHPSCSKFDELFLYLMDEYKENIETAILGDLEYFSLVFENCKGEIQSGESLLLNLIYETKIDSQESISQLINFYGLPIVEGNNLTLMPKNPDSDSKDFSDMANLRALELVINRFTGRDRKCQLYEKCLDNLYRDESPNGFEMSAECRDEQWKKREVCLMSVSMIKYGLDNKTIIQHSY